MEPRKSAPGEIPLVEMVRRSSERPDFELAIEMYDDVSLEADGTPLKLLQLKHHLNSTGALGDKDSDLWPKIASWMDSHSPDDAGGPTLTLVTTQAGCCEGPVSVTPERRELRA